MSALTDILERLAAKSNATSPTTSSTTNKTVACRHTTEKHNPKFFKYLNDGKGRVFASYCWRCGCNCTHWTRGCNRMTLDEDEKYQAAGFDNHMNGSTMYLEQRDHYQ
eukprot:CAMPEP_0168171626 /NCGR_PEP_ID=MMETSP0139_2-20121125/4801_1 /TAXON_ID=44445 /ORGANISM="Pseudo-nitzschia australis, Strain 10249 10 AB" /LENGTH=107 /DNA_ID=CAMNT_0008089183 /DNA_START=390 /DNA_END=713 /DNA_ORIENTATION=-